MKSRQHYAALLFKRMEIINVHLGLPALFFLIQKKTAIFLPVCVSKMYILPSWPTPK